MRGQRFWIGVAVGAAVAWWFSRPGGGGNGGRGGAAPRSRGRMSWSGLGRYR